MEKKTTIIYHPRMGEIKETKLLDLYPTKFIYMYANRISTAVSLVIAKCR